MTIDEAIKILNRDRFDNPDYHLKDFQEAIDLSIAALKRVRETRSSPLGYTYSLLPGETVEKGERRVK